MAAANSSVLSGITAAVAAPALSTIGLILWDKHWRGSVFSLNLFKCMLATPLFLLVCLSPAHRLSELLAALTARAVAALCISSFLGIVVGDSAWLASIKILGARRVLLIDSLKPFVAALAGGVLFGEYASWLSISAMSLSVIGVLVVALEQEAPGAAGTNKWALHQRLWGYFLALAAVVLDVSGSALTKGFGVGLGPWAIGGVRFGFAGLCLGAFSMALHAAEGAKGKGVWPWQRRSASTVEDSPVRRRSSGSLDDTQAQWYEMPRQSARAWGRAAAGVVFITFLNPALNNHAVMTTPLSLYLTLGSLGPVISLPLLWLLKGEKASLRAIAGSALAVVAAAVFCSEVSLE